MRSRAAVKGPNYTLVVLRRGAITGRVELMSSDISQVEQADGPIRLLNLLVPVPCWEEYPSYASCVEAKSVGDPGARSEPLKTAARTPPVATYEDAREPPASGLKVAVAVCTRDRPQQLLSCLNRLQATISYDIETVIVDNAPVDLRTADLVDKFQASGMNIRRVVEPRPGLSNARNCALESIDADIVAFTDDDAVVDTEWIYAIGEPFAQDKSIALVTGMVLPARLETSAQEAFQSKMQWSEAQAAATYWRGMDPRPAWVFPYAAGHFGTGANFAVRRAEVLLLGGFNERLGAGTRTQGGEDLEMFVRVIKGGRKLAYTPTAFVWHDHRLHMAQLNQLMYGYGKGLSATVTSLLLQADKGDIKDIARATTEFLRRRCRSGVGSPSARIDLYEAAGLLVGPFAYLWEGLVQRMSEKLPASNGIQLL